MTLQNILTVLAIIIGPIVAVLISNSQQKKIRQYEIKLNSFLTLMAYRRDPLNPKRIETLNTIEVIWGRHPNIVHLWREYYEVLHSPPELAFERWSHSHLRLLHQMAKILGYRHIDQVDIDKCYVPVGDKLSSDTPNKK